MTYEDNPKLKPESKGIMYIETAGKTYVGTVVTAEFYGGTVKNLGEANYTSKKIVYSGGDDGIEGKGFMYTEEHLTARGKYKHPSLSFMYCRKVRVSDMKVQLECPTKKNTRDVIGKDAYVNVVGMEEFKKTFYKVYPWK